MRVHSGESLKGVLAAALAFLIWGLIPVYWKLLVEVNSYELLLHRIVWSFLFLVILVRTGGRWKRFIAAFGNREMLRYHAFGGILLACNWLAFIHAVTHGKILQASLAYFIVPLTNSGLGFLVLKEPISKVRGIAILLATVGVLNEIVQVAEFPWLALVMAGSFGLYSLLKKKTTLGTVTGLTLENTVIFPLAGIALVALSVRGGGVLLNDPWHIRGLILLAGAVTSVPLLLFSYGAARIQLNTLGFIQFIGPMVKFALAVWLFHEPFSSVKLVTFGFIWAGIAFYLWDSLYVTRIKDVQPDL